MDPGSESDKIKWLPDVEEHDYAAAQLYLLLLYRASRVRKIILGLRSARMTRFKAKDIFRASSLPLLGVGNFHVEKDQRKLRAGKGMSPLLLVRDETIGKLIIADGYHRLCAVYSFDEDAWVECKIV